MNTKNVNHLICLYCGEKHYPNPYRMPRCEKCGDTNFKVVKAYKTNVFGYPEDTSPNDDPPEDPYF